jgi:hypothetical protein
MPIAIPTQIQPLLDDYVRLVSSQLPGLLEGLYLHGSVALGAFDAQLSDIDFIAVTSRRCNTAEIANLRTIHQTLARAYPLWQLEGSYLCWSDLGRLTDSMPPHPCIHDGVLSPSGYHDINLVTWWLLAHHGIAVVGPPPDQLAIHVDWDELVARMKVNLSTYWAAFITKPPRMAWLLDDYGIQWTVLGVLRQVYSFREGSITSKVGAGAYGRTLVPARWQRLIQEALNIRAGTHASLYRSRLERAIEAHAFLCTIVTAYKPGSRSSSGQDL